MRLPIELIAAILLAKVFQDSASGAGPSLWAALASGAALIGGAWLIPRLGWLALRRRLRELPELRPAVYEEHARLAAGARCFTVAAYGAFLYGTGWSALMHDWLAAAFAPAGGNPDPTVIGDDLLQLLPFLGASVALWIGDYPAVRELSPADWSLPEYLGHQARGTLFLLGPWLGMVLVFDSQPYWPWGLAELFRRSLAAQLGLTALVFAAAVLLFPLYLARLWPAQPLPGGELRARLEALLARARVGCRELLVWNTGRARLPNAAVMGLVRPLRYVAFTDALLAELAPEEVEAVLAHEVGHVRHQHMGFYALFAASFLVFGAVGISLLPQELVSAPAPESQAAVALALVALVVVYWRLLFGYLSRRFERQADAAACELLGSAGPLVAALEKLAAVAGSPRAARSWRHYSVAERVAFLERVGPHRELLGDYHRYVRKVKLAAALIALLALAVVLLRELGARSGAEATGTDAGPDRPAPPAAGHE